jgi:hypothetical protein
MSVDHNILIPDVRASDDFARMGRPSSYPVHNASWHESVKELTYQQSTRVKTQVLSRPEIRNDMPRRSI